MRGLSLIPYNTKINFVGLRYIGFALSFLILVGSFVSLATKGLNLGIDFKGGLVLEVRTPGPSDLAQMRQTLNGLEMGEVKLQEFGSNRDVMIRMEARGDEKQQMQDLNRIKQSLGSDIEYRRVETVGGKVSADVVENGIWAVLFSMIGMLVYIWFRFEWQYGLCGIIALFHDAVAVLGFYSISGYEFKETAFAAILTTVAYSINDSVVVYDRLRENFRKYKNSSLFDVLNLSTNETLSRTILTSSTTLLALLALYIFGGPVIENFSLPIFVGIAFGTFSSIFVSVNLLVYFDPRKKKSDE